MPRTLILLVLLAPACGGAQRATLESLAVIPQAQLTPNQLNDAIYDANQRLFESGKNFGLSIWQVITGEAQPEKLKAEHENAKKTYRIIKKNIKALEPKLPPSKSARDFYQAFLAILEAEGKVILESGPEILTVVEDESLTKEEKDERITKIVAENKKITEKARKRLVKAFEAFSFRHDIENP